MAKALTDLAIQKMKPGVIRREVPDGAQRGLYLVVQTSGRKGFCVRYRYAGRPRKLTLEAGIGLAAARKEAAAALYEVQQGKDPAAAKARRRDEQRDAEADTFEAVCANFFKRDGAKLRSAHDWDRDLKRLVYPVFGRRPISDIRRKQIVSLLDDAAPRLKAASAASPIVITASAIAS